jgi:hypothetical protein
MVLTKEKEKTIVNSRFDVWFHVEGPNSFQIYLAQDGIKQEG